MFLLWFIIVFRKEFSISCTHVSVYSLIFRVFYLSVCISNLSITTSLYFQVQFTASILAFKILQSIT